MAAPRKVWDIEGDHVDLDQIMERVGPDVPRERVRKRLRRGSRTWRELMAAPGLVSKPDGQTWDVDGRAMTFEEIEAAVSTPPAVLLKRLGQGWNTLAELGQPVGVRRTLHEHAAKKAIAEQAEDAKRSEQASALWAWNVGASPARTIAVNPLVATL